MQDVKFTNDNNELKVSGWLVRFGGADLDNEYFDKNTNFGFEKTKEFPTFFEHGNGELQKIQIGKGVATINDEGIFYESVLNRHNKYLEMVARLAKQGMLGWSSGAVSHVSEKGKGGYIKQWILGEASLTAQPAEVRNLIKEMKMEKVLKAKEYYIKNKSLLNEFDGVVLTKEEELKLQHNDFTEVIKMLNIKNYL